MDKKRAFQKKKRGELLVDKNKLHLLKNYITFSYIINFLLLLFLVSILDFLPPQLPFFYGMPYGEDQLVARNFILSAPLAGIVITSLNLVLARLIQEGLIKKVLETTSLIMSFLILVTVLKIVFLIGFFKL